MKRLLLLAVAVPSLVWGRGVSGFRAALAAPDSLYASRITVVEASDAAALVSRLDGVQSTDRIRGQRICIYSDNSQNARTNAQNVMEQFRGAYPDIPVYMDYETPYFKVKVGNCINYEEAITLWGQVKGLFPKAIMTDAVIPVSELKK